MKISEHANYLLNEYGRLQFDYAAYCKPNGESLRNEARNNLETYIAELEADNNRLKCSYDTQTETFVYGKDSKPIPCPFCGEIVKECNDVATPIDVALRKRIAELEGKIDQLTAHSDIERQDDKSSNDTQTSTIVYGKEREE